MSSKLLDLPAKLSRFPEVAGCYRETAQWFPLALGYLRLRELKYPIIVSLRSGGSITLQERIDLVIFWLVFVRKHYPVHASDLVIVDVGANIGLFTIYAARQAQDAKIIAVEPFPDTCLRLRKHLQENHLTNRVTVANCALAGNPGGGGQNGFRRRNSEPIPPNPL
jgi:Met-10+ like-protein